MPKLRAIFSLVSRPFWWPITMQGVPLKRAKPPTIERSSANVRSPCTISARDRALASGRLAGIPRPVRPGEERRHLLALVVLGNADGDRDRPLAQGCEPRGPDRTTHALRRSPCAIERSTGKNQQELLATKAPEDIDRTQARGSEGRQLLEHRVARGVAEVIVDRLEVVDIHQAHGER